MMVTEVGLPEGARRDRMPDSTDTKDPEDTETRIREAWARDDFSRAVDIFIRAYGPGIRGYLAAWLHSRCRGDDAYGMFTVDLMNGLPRFRWEGTARNFGYVLAHRAACRYLKKERRYTDLSDGLLSGLAAPVCTRTASYLKTDFKERLRELRERLPADDQALLMLRVNRGLSFPEIAAAFLKEGFDAGKEELKREDDRLRKQFERMKERLEKLAREEGLI
jgi:RNA polymerase sigma-70 factor (ECF subfamily)